MRILHLADRLTDRGGAYTWLLGILEGLSAGKVARGLLFGTAEERARTWDGIFRPMRQPAGWNGDDAYHAPMASEPVSELERRLKAGEFTVACEIAPPQSVSISKLTCNIDLVKPYVSAINFTDNASSISRMSSWACSKIAIENGAEPVMQIAARDRTRTSLQAEVVGSNALGVRNILCL